MVSMNFSVGLLPVGSEAEMRAILYSASFSLIAR